VVGCPIERVEIPDRPIGPERVRRGSPEPPGANEGPVAVGRVTYAAGIAAIVQGKCQECHRPGQVGPFPLLSYDDARRRAATIREVIEERRMPPWHADPRFGKFVNDRRLSARERAVLLAWIEQDCPLGDPKDLPPPRAFPEGWQIGAPDVVFEMPEPYVVPAQGTLPYQNFRVPTNFREDTWVQAAEVRPGDRSVVHHITVSVIDPKAGPLESVRDRDQFLTGYSPGSGSHVYPEGVAKLIPAGSELIFQVHYTPVGRAKSDRSRLGLIVARRPPRRRIANINICSWSFSIPPGDANHEVKTQFTFTSDTTVLSLKPHMHLRGKDFKFTATYPDATSEVLLSVPAYDFGWQPDYQLVEPKRMPKGTRIDCLAHFDNSTANLANPDATKTVRVGLQTDDEMMCGILQILVDVPDQGKVSASAPARQ
jgi:mono/diheme cytochrome c family protein